jgi:hypothetical protein
MQGSFSSESLKLYESLIEELENPDFSEYDLAAYDFTRCVRPNGTVYGTGGKCRKGTEQRKGSSVATAAKKQSLKERMEAAGARLESNAAPPKPTAKATPKPKASEPASATPKPKVSKPVSPVAEQTTKAIPTPKKTVKATPEEVAEKKAREKYAKARAVIDSVQDKHDAIKREIFEATGKGVFYTGQNRRTFDAKVKELGLPSESKLNQLIAKANALKTPKMREEERKAQEEKRLKEFQTQTKEQKREKIQEFLKSMGDKDLESLTQDIRTWSDLVKNNPEYRTTTNINALIAMRALRMKAFQGTKEERSNYKAEQAKLLENSPKYSSTPGSSKPVPKTTRAQQVKLLEGELKTIQSKIDKLNENNQADQAKKWKLEANKNALEFQLDRAKKVDTWQIDPGLPILYKLQGFDAKPEVVKTRADLESRADVAKHPDGRPIIAFRGVTSEEFSHQLKGGGPDGDIHFSGAGIYGNGTYAASAPKTGDTKHDRWAQKTAVSYSGSGGNTERRVTAFAFRSDANLAQFSDAGEYHRWTQKIMKEASKKTGYEFTDIGHAAAAMGIHAYSIPQGGEDYWVVLNRGAMIVATDPQLTPRS